MIYISYFFTGVRTADMSPALTALLGTIRMGVLLLISFLAQGLADQFTKGDYNLNFTTIQGYVMPGVALLLGLIWKYAREASNPAVSIAKIDTVSSMLPPRDPNVPRQ